MPVMNADMNADRPGDARRNRLRERLESIRVRSEKSTSWHSPALYLGRLINREGFVPVRARITQEDLAFFSTAREDLIAFAELGLRLLELHQPRDSGGISSDPNNPIRRCHACMWRWPCPTFRAIGDTVDH
jgi:hypothetical protein